MRSCEKFCRWRFATGVAAMGLLAFGFNVKAQQRPTQLFDVTTGQPIPGSRGKLEGGPVSAPKMVIFSVQSPEGSAATGGTVEAPVYVQPDNRAGSFSIFLNYGPTTGASFPGTMMADNQGLSDEFAGVITSYTIGISHSGADPLGAADIHVELWDGDPFCAADTEFGTSPDPDTPGFFCGAVIPGTEADFVDIPAISFLEVELTAVLPVKVTTAAQRVWMVLSGSEPPAGDLSPCRMGWLLGRSRPTIGTDFAQVLFDNFGTSDLAELQEDADGVGACCADGSACNVAGGSPCPDDATGSRGFCSDGDAESAAVFNFGEVCGAPEQDCANFVASIFSPAAVTMSLVPVSVDAPPSAGSAAGVISLSGNEVVLQDGGHRVFLELRIGDFDPDETTNNCSESKEPCTTDADCVLPAEVCQGTQISAYQATLNATDGFVSGVQGVLTYPLVPCTGGPAGNPDCRAVFGGRCSVFGDPCVVAADCQIPAIETCNGMACDPAGSPLPPGSCGRAFIDSNRPDFIMLPVPNIPAAGQGFDVFWAAARGDIPSADDPDPFPADGLYGGSTTVDVPADAKGTFTLEFIADASFLTDQNSQFIPLLGFVPAKITVQLGSCCLDVGGPNAACIDGITAPQCDAQPGNTLFTAGASCVTCDTADDCLAAGLAPACVNGFCCAECSVAGLLSGPGPRDCQDSDACTDDSCTDDLLCQHDPRVCSDGLICTLDNCNPADPADIGCDFTKPLDCDDGLACTIDTCVEPGGCVNEKIDCRDDDPCSVDSCVEPAGVCSNINLDLPPTIPCPTGNPADCPTVDQFTGQQIATTCVDGFCRCSVCETNVSCDAQNACRATLSLDIVPSNKPNPNCFLKGEKIIVNAHKTPGGFPVPAAIPINAAQFTVFYDPDCVQFNSISPVAPFELPLAVDVDETAGRIFYAVGVDPFAGVDGPAGEADIATLSFTKLSGCVNCNFRFSGANPQNTFFTDADGQPICADTEDSKEIHENDVVTLTVPDNVKVNADCNRPSATVTWDAPTSSSSCEDAACNPAQEKCYEAPLECMGTHETRCERSKEPCTVDADCAIDEACVGRDMTALAMSGGEHPQGVTTYECWTGSNICGDTVHRGWTVTVNDQQTLDVTLQLSPTLAPANLSRCIKFELFSDCVQAPLVFERDLLVGGLFDFIGHFSEPIKTPASGHFGCITARDQLHSLRSCAFLTCGPGGVWEAVFKGDPFFGGNWLIQGNLDGWKKDNPNASHDVIDILDFGQFVANFLTVTNPNTPCPTLEGHADINSDGIVDALDFSFVTANFGESSKDCCCPGGAAGSTVARTEVSLRELRQMGLADLAVADLNGDGLVNMDDMAAFLAGEVPAKDAPTRDRKGSGLRSR